MAIHGSNRSRGSLWLRLLVMLGAALVSLPAFVQWDGSAQAQEQEGRGHQITLERNTDPDFQRELTEAGNRGSFDYQIVGGTRVPEGKYPYMTFMQVDFGKLGVGECGGTLIDPDSVLTAAHCVVDDAKKVVAQRVDLVVGRTDLSQKNQGQVRSVPELWVHPSYNGAVSSRYDVAVLKLDSPVTGVQPIKLAARQNNLESPGRLLTAAGWGLTSEGGKPSNPMLEVSVPVVSDSKARKAYSPAPPTFQYDPRLMVAAGAQRISTCQGDSGGPLFNPGATPKQVGIVSFANGCARAGYPTAYTEVNNSGIRTFIVNSAKQ
jgi:secreted trypsin-like serine protease